MRETLEKAVIGVSSGLVSVGFTMTSFTEWLRVLGSVGTLAVCVLTCISLWQQIKKNREPK